MDALSEPHISVGPQLTHPDGRRQLEIRHECALAEAAESFMAPPRRNDYNENDPALPDTEIALGKRRSPLGL